MLSVRDENNPEKSPLRVNDGPIGEQAPAEVRKRYGVSHWIVYYWIENRLVIAYRRKSGAPYGITITDEADHELREWVAIPRNSAITANQFGPNRMRACAPGSASRSHAMPHLFIQVTTSYLLRATLHVFEKVRTPRLIRSSSGLLPANKREAPQAIAGRNSLEVKDVIKRDTCRLSRPPLLCS
jgi:hypothetical protein